LEQRHEDAGSGADEADEESNPRRPWMLLIELLVVVLLVLVTSDKSLEKADEGSASGQGEADEESCLANQPISDKRDDPPGAGEGDDPPATVASDKSATSKRFPEKHNEGTPPGEAEEESRPANQPISDERDDPPGAGKGPPVIVASDTSASSRKPAEEHNERTRPGKADDESHPANQPISDKRDDPPGANEGDDPSVIVASDTSATSQRPPEKRSEDTRSGEADEESRPANQPISDERDDPPGAGKDDDPPAVVASDTSATSERPPEKHNEGTRPGEADEESRPANQPISDKRDDPPGAGKGPPVIVASDTSATSQRPPEKRSEDTRSGEADEESRPANQPISDERDDPPGAGKDDDPPAVVASDKSATFERPLQKHNEGTRPGEADEESRPPDQPIGRAPDTAAAAGESDRAALLGKPEEKAEVERSAVRETEMASRPSDLPLAPERDSGPSAREGDRAAASDEPAERADEDARARDKAAEEHRQARRPWVLAIGVIVVALLIAGGLYYWWTTRNLESTDDAFTDGRAVTMAPQVAGEVISLDVNDNQFVKQGQAVVRIDPRQYKNSRDQAEGALATAKAQYAGQRLAAEIAKKNFPAQLDQAKAQLESAKANLTKTKADYARQISLQKPATTQQDVDQAATALWQAEAQVKLAEAQVTQNSPVPQQIGQSEAQVRQLKGQIEQAQAQLDQAELNLSWTIVTAPQDGWITRRNVEKGNYVVAGQQIMSIVTPEVWVTANFKETQLTYMKPGQPVKIRIDAYPSLDVRGHVDSIQRGSGSKFTAFPPENATGNFVKIVQRVPVKIVIDSGIPPDIAMPLGISVVPTVTVR
jgi:membrane fusion protein, multidrug efflux system